MLGLFIPAFALMLGACVLVYAWIAFINGILLPDLLASVYIFIPSTVWRTVVSVCTLGIVANFMLAKGYAISNGAVGGAAYVVALILCMVGYAVITEGVKINWHILGGTAGLMVCAVWVVYGLNIKGVV